MSLINVFEDDQQRNSAHVVKKILGTLIQTEQYVGDVYSLGYEAASVQIHDFYRRKVGGIPSLCFLIATRIAPGADNMDYQQEDTSIVLLRVMDACALPSDAEAERLRVEIAQKVAGEHNIHWDDNANMDATTHHLLSFAGIKCRVIGTFFVDKSERTGKLGLRFGSDISNYYPNQGLKVYKPNKEALQEIVNYVDPDRFNETESQAKVTIGEVRYASTNRSFQGVSNVKVSIYPADLLNQKTALFGMTRTGKSNTTKIILQSVFKLRFDTTQPYRIGQIVFDPNGEYANENAQDANQQNIPSAIKNVWQSHDDGDSTDVVTYGVVPHPNDPNRRLMLLNFFEESNLQTGKEIIDNILTLDSTKFIQNFRQVVFERPPSTDRSATTRFDRHVVVYRALLAKAGFTVPDGLKPRTAKLFNSELIAALRASAGENAKDHQAAATHLANPDATWNQLATAFGSLYDFMQDKKSGYGAFDDTYMNRSGGSGDPWADETLKKLLEMFKYPNGVRQIGKVTAYHTEQTSSDYAAVIYEDLVAGRLVIIDQSSGDPELNKASAERIMWEIFRAQQAVFREG